MKIFKVLVLILVLLASFNYSLFAEEAKDLEGEVQALREEVKILREELRAVKKEASVSATVAQEETVSEADLAGLRSDLDTLREQWQRTLDKKTAQTTRSLALSGTVQTRYTQSDAETANAKNGFSISSLILALKGNLYKDYELGRNLNYAFSLSSATTGDFKIAPLDAYLSYDILPTIDKSRPLLSLTLGQQKKPFGRDPQTTDEYKPTIKVPLTDSNLGLGTRDIGLIVKGDLFPVLDYGFNYRAPLIEYAFGVINGAGPNTVGDTNSQKDFVGRIGFNAPVDYNSIFRGLSAGISGWDGQKSLSLGSGASAITRRGDKQRWGYDLAYNRTPIGVTMEYAQGTDETISGAVADPIHGSVKSEGYIFTGFYNFGQQFFKNRTQDRYDDWFPKTLQPFIRYETWDPNKAIEKDEIITTTLGLNWFFAETTKLQFNVNFVNNSRKNTTVNNGSDYTEYLAQFQYGF